MAERVDIQIVNRLRESGEFRRVTAVLDPVAVVDEGQIMGNAEAWVAEIRSQASRPVDDIDTNPVQIETREFAVIIGLRNLDDPVGEKARTQIEENRSAVRTALYGFIPASTNGSYGPLVVVRSQMLRLGNPVTFWAEVFSTTHVIDGENPL